MSRPVIVRGTDKSLVVRLVSQTTGDPIDLSSVTEIEVILKNEDDSCKELFLNDTGITILNPFIGKIQIDLLAAETALLKLSNPDDDPVYPGIEIKLTFGSAISIVNLPQSIDVQDPLFPDC